MRDSADAFHLAIPARDLDEAQDFYVAKLGCHLARRYADRITVDFFGDQLVCHLSEEVDEEMIFTLAISA
jgi:extradiol dioxygenase family protein